MGFVILTGVLISPGKVMAQNYSDSTMVYLELMPNADPSLRTVVVHWIEPEDTDPINVSYRVRDSGGVWVTASGNQNDIPDATVKRKTVHLNSLVPGTAYEFRIKAQTEEYYFRTMPANLNSTVRFMVAGDIYGDGSNPVVDTQLMEEITAHARQGNPYFAVLAGDIIHMPVTDVYDVTTLLRFFKFLNEWYKNMVTPQGYMIPIVAAYGNHELPERFGGVPESAKYFNAIFNFPGTQGYRALDFGSYLSLIVLNSNHTRPVEGAQTTWLQARLAERTAVTNVFPVYHVPAYPSRRDAIPGRGLEVLQNWVPIFEQYNVRMAFEHDNHAYKRTYPIRNNQVHPCGVRYFGDGGFAYPTGPADTTKWYIQHSEGLRHYLYVTLTSTNRRVQMYAHTGANMDDFSQSIGITPPTILSASNVEETSFTARWEAVCSATSYRLDVSTDPNFASFLPGYSDLNVGNITSSSVTGLNSTTVYYYRVRAVGSSQGTSGNSNAMSVTTKQPPPLAQPATNITTSGFTANWQAVSGSNQYRMDLATDADFTNLVPAYTDFNLGNTTSYNVTGLNSATTYYYRIRARNTNLNLTSANSGLIGLITRPEVPQLLPIASLEAKSFLLRWDAVPRVDQYRLDVSTNPGFSSYVSGYQNFIIPGGTSYLITGLEPQTTYFYRLRARSTTLDVTSASSDTGTTTTLPEAPENVMVSNINTNSFTVSWDEVDNINIYLLDVATNIQFTQFADGYNNRDVGNNSTFNVSGLNPQTAYYVRVRSRNTTADLTSINSDTLVTATLPPVPQNLAVSDLGPDFFTLSWDEIDLVDDYELDLSTESDFSSYVEGYDSLSLGKVTSYQLTELQASTRYYYRLRSKNTDLDVMSANSDTDSIITLPDAPSNLVIAELNSDSFTLTWDDGEPAGQYFLDLSTDPDFEQFVDGFEDFDLGDVTLFAITDLTPVSEYYLRLRVKSTVTDLISLDSDVLEIVTIPTTPVLLPPSNIRAVRVTAQWEEVENVTSYLLDLSTDPDFTSYYGDFEGFDVGDVTEYQFAGLIPGETYYYRVRARNADFDVVSNYSNVRDVTTIAIDQTLSTLEADRESLLADGVATSTIVATLRDENSNLMEEVIVTLTAGSGTSEINTIQGMTDSDGRAVFVVSNFTAERITYSATIGNNNLNQSVTIDFIPLPPIVEAAADIRASRFTVNWQSVAGAVEYRLDVSTNQDFSSFVNPYSDFSVGDGNSYQVSGLFPGETYYYRIRTVAVTGPSADSETNTITTPQADPNLTEVEVVDAIVLADGEQVGVVNIIIKGEDGLVMDGVPVQLISDETNSIVTPVINPSNQSGLVTLHISNTHSGAVVYTVMAGSIEISTKVTIDFKPIPPLAQGSSVIGAIEFTATWEEINGAVSYLLDVSTTADFSTFVEGYQNLNVGNATEWFVSGLAPGVTYYYRVRAATDTSVSDDSNVSEVTTYMIDVVNSEAVASLQRVLANGEQMSLLTIKLVSEDGDPLPDVRVIIEPSSPDFIVIPDEEITNEDGEATFNTVSSTAGEATYKVFAGGLELDTKINIIFLFSDGVVRLGHNFPNPFGFSTKIPVTIPERMNVRLHIYNSSGALVDVLANQEFAAGYYEVEFTPRGLASGVYLCRMITSDGVQIEKMMYVK